MSFLTGLILKAAYYGITLGKITYNPVYPVFQAHQAYKQDKVERIWLLYFFIFGIFTILEGTVLFPVKYL